jgi:hypothetical protein
VGLGGVALSETFRLCAALSEAGMAGSSGCDVDGAFTLYYSRSQLLAGSFESINIES